RSGIFEDCMDIAHAFNGDGIFKQLLDLAVCKLCLQGFDLSCLCFQFLCNCLCLGNNLCLTSCFKLGSDCTDDTLCVIQQFQHAHAGCCLDTSDTCCNRGLGDDLEGTDLAGIVNMGTAAELNRVAHGADADDVAVFLTEQCHCTFVLGFCD